MIHSAKQWVGIHILDNFCVYLHFITVGTVGSHDFQKNGLYYIVKVYQELLTAHPYVEFQEFLAILGISSSSSILFEKHTQ